MVERQIEHGKPGLVLSARFPVVNWRSLPVGKSAYYGERSICYLQAPLRARWVFRTHPSLSRVSGVIAIISEFTQQDGRKKRTAKRVCVINVSGLLLASFVVIFT